jgi:hypothetical protein
MLKLKIMEAKEEIKKEAWSEPQIYSLDFKATEGGNVTSQVEGTGGTISTLPG